jgi:hypothetical protein
MTHWKKCYIATCIRPAHKEGLCDAHFGRKDLDPGIPIRPPTYDPYHKYKKERAAHGTRRATPTS